MAVQAFPPFLPWRRVAECGLVHPSKALSLSTAGPLPLRPKVFFLCKFFTLQTSCSSFISFCSQPDIIAISQSCIFLSLFQVPSNKTIEFAAAFEDNRFPSIRSIIDGHTFKNFWVNQALAKRFHLTTRGIISKIWMISDVMIQNLDDFWTFEAVFIKLHLPSSPFWLQICSKMNNQIVPDFRRFERLVHMTLNCDLAVAFSSFHLSLSPAHKPQS